VFQNYAKQIKQLAPNAFVLNYTNPMGALTKTLAHELGPKKVVGLCHGLFSCYAVLRTIFHLPSEKNIQVRFGGVNHFFWILDLIIDGQDGHKMLRDKLGDRNLATLMREIHKDAIGHSSDMWVCGELLQNYGYLSFVADRHISEFFGCYITNKAVMNRYKLVRTSIADREKMYAAAAADIERWTNSEGGLDKSGHRETAADVIKAVLYNDNFIDVVNLINVGQIPSLPMGAVVETLGQVNSSGFTPLACGPLPETINPLVRPHADVQLRTVEAALAGDLNAALLALAEDPACANLPISDIKKMGMELLEPNKKYMPNLFKT
jgi:alpha-galactosidase